MAGPRDLAVAGCLFLCAVVSAAAQPAPTSAPGRVADRVKDLIDDYTQGDERQRFFDAGGMDGELSKEEFQAAAGKGKSFVRPYDRWEHAIASDTDGNGQLNWPEAERYRLSVRDRVLGEFDQDHDGRLTGPERDAANAFLSAGLGKARLAEGGATSRPRREGRVRQGRPAESPAAPLAEPASRPAGTRAWTDWLARHDADGNGQLSDSERQAMIEDLQKQAEQLRQAYIAKYDADGDGQLNAQEQKAAAEDALRQGQELRRQRELQRWDKNRDGALDEQERAEMENEQRALRQTAQRLQREWLRRWDADGDGKLSDSERQAMTDSLRQQAQRRLKEMDADGDGTVSPKEFQAYTLKLVEKYDADGDGKLSDQERQKMLQEEGGSWWGPGGADWPSPYQQGQKK
jgi:Ca2+-binding EF-hand superfamily protein